MSKPKTQAADYARVTLRLPSPVLEALRRQAEALGRPINTHMIHVLRDGLAVTKAPKLPRDVAHVS